MNREEAGEWDRIDVVGNLKQTGHRRALFIMKEKIKLACEPPKNIYVLFIFSFGSQEKLFYDHSLLSVCFV